MKIALALAEKGRGRVRPNPMVGALVVKDGMILGEGAHLEYGGPHAEANALADCRSQGNDPVGAELYVTLEPCSFRSPEKHNGPCTEKIIEAGIRRVIIARPDPNPKVMGRGIAALKKAGIEVVAGVLEEDSAALNEVYEHLISSERPWIHLKVALTLDGFIAAEDGSSKWISGPDSRARVMEMRRDCDAVLVGRGTWEADSPSLTVRDSEGRELPGYQPRKIVFSGRESGGTLFDRLCALRSEGVHSILVEGGSGVFNSFLTEGLWDRLTVFQSPDFLGSGIPFCGSLGIGNIGGKVQLKGRTTEISGRDVVISGTREDMACLQV
ncbi:MAG: bifunctional diaminohydroxyphosphoribosylaminopyrimidine deaminase/5-amino-6-(5-phosphoribosylamino)uracil reductase RibD [Spirochaetales bacterium]|nr:bifunctional diaminohydroxyphosphoribosylaminopyrimidine deaminase/5-amino-6-(5-phosphoribosylamino)uracil reductase RibD [Spirochaetales bacterium]